MTVLLGQFTCWKELRIKNKNSMKTDSFVAYIIKYVLSKSNPTTLDTVRKLQNLPQKVLKESEIKDQLQEKSIAK